MRKYIPLALSIALVLVLNLYFRSFLINLPQFKDLAKRIVGQRIQQVAAQSVYRKFPQFDPLAKERLIKTLAADYRRQNKAAIKKQVEDLYLQLKDKYQDERGSTYLMELDCWHWARYVENVLRLGHPGDETVYGAQLDLFMLAPLGYYLHWDQFLFYLSASLYKFFSLFKSVPLFTFLFYLPLFFATIFIIVLFSFSFRFGRYIAGIVSCIFIGLSPIFLQRSCAGWFDKDILNLLFPLLVVWTYILAAVGTDLIRRTGWVCLSAFWLGLFCFTWTHWWFVLFLILIYEAFSLICLWSLRVFLKEDVRAQLKQHILSILFFIFFGAFWILVLAGHKPLEELYRQTRLALILNKPLMSSVWPNVYSTVGELRRMRFIEIAQSIGNPWIFFASVISLFVLLVRSLFKEEYAGFKREGVIILVFWFVAMAFASTRGVRFFVFLLLPLGIALGWGMSELFEYARSRRNVWIVTLTVAAVAALGIFFVGKANGTARSTYPLIDDSWYKILNMIREKTPENTILNSWWDFGDWFKVVARRRVIFDGQSQYTPQAYWMAKSILSNDEEQAVAILRMLNNGGNRAFEIINQHVKDELRSVLLLESVLNARPDDARSALLEHLPVLAADEVMRLLFYKPARACFIVDNTMIPKMPAISYLGNWDFSKVYIVQNFNSREKDAILDYLKKLGRDSLQIQRFYQEVFLIAPENIDTWLSTRLQFYGGLASGREKEGVIFFENGCVYDPKEQTLALSNGQIPRSLFVLEGDAFVERPLANANAPFSALVYNIDNTYKCIVLDRELANSLFVRLYCLRGKGLKHFLPFIDAEDANNYIRVFNIAW